MLRFIAGIFAVHANMLIGIKQRLQLVFPALVLRHLFRLLADARGVFLSDEAMDFMLRRFSRDLSSLMQLLDKLDGYALQTQRAITIPLIKAMLESE